MERDTNVNVVMDSEDMEEQTNVVTSPTNEEENSDQDKVSVDKMPVTLNLLFQEQDTDYEEEVNLHFTSKEQEYIH
jgi:hypothetical protein